jgi:hypothetical protein
MVMDPRIVNLARRKGLMAGFFKRVRQAWPQLVERFPALGRILLGRSERLA